MKKGNSAFLQSYCPIHLWIYSLFASDRSLLLVGPFGLCAAAANCAGPKWKGMTNIRHNVQRAQSNTVWWWYTRPHSHSPLPLPLSHSPAQVSTSHLILDIMKCQRARLMPSRTHFAHRQLFDYTPFRRVRTMASAAPVLSARCCRTAKFKLMLPPPYRDDSIPSNDSRCLSRF